MTPLFTSLPLMLGPLRIGLEEGMKYIPFMLAASIVLRMARFPDFGLEGTFVAGAASIAFTSSHGLPSVIGLILAAITGCLGGFLTSGLLVKFHLNSLICGIITSMFAFTGAFFFLNFRAAADVPVFASEHVVGICGILLASLLVLLFSTRYFLVLRFAGESPALLAQLGIKSGGQMMILMGVGNAICSVGGALVAGVEGSVNLAFGKLRLLQAIVGLIMGEGILAMLVSGLELFARRIMNKPPVDKMPNWRYRLSVYLSGTGIVYAVTAAVVGSLAYWITFNLCTHVFGANEYTPMVLGVTTIGFLVFSERMSGRMKRLPSWSFLGGMP